MNSDQYGPYGPRRPGPPPPPPAFAVPPQKQRGKGCLYAFIGCVATLFLMVSCVAVVANSGGSSDPAATSETSTPAKGTANGGKDEEKKVKNGVGREYRDGKFAFTVTKVKKGVKQVGNQYLGDTAQGQFVIISVTVKNIGDNARTFTHHNQTLIDTRNREFEADPEASMWSEQDTKSFLQQINPGNSVKGKLIYDVPRGTKLKAVKLHDSMFSGGTTVPLGGR
ncbi:DUF4352 domain-containing protein [Actinomadura sp. 7K507]|uniref:DUF4352 domain-containing protein n=1 Tax=Actinomadura sp. 7K507 TaxID=2530365 RepID=UPI00104A6050|nr:DUF4352 domain-containing protein [Actinomadura sp. 7K507]TDC76189.1 DUF4352 domain-containing protein [Actinomadura sp. 7K507]